MRGRERSPSSKIRTTSEPAKSGRSCTVDIAGIGADDALRGKSTSASPSSLKPTSMPRVAWTASLRPRDLAVPISPLVLKDLLPLHRDILACFHIDLAGALDRDVLALNGDCSILLHNDRSAPGFEHDLVPGR